MNSKKIFLRGAILSFVLLVGFQAISFAQTVLTPNSAPPSEIMLFQYCRVASDKRDEFIKRETTYWAEVAKQALTKGNLTFWALLEKVSGDNMENAPNFLFIKIYKDVDNTGDIWNPTTAFPKVTIDKMETGSLSKVTAMIYLKSQDWQQAVGSVPDRDFKWMSVVYHNTSNPNYLLKLERKHWSPFIKDAMEKKLTKQLGWGNAILLSPFGGDVNFTTISYDLFPKLKDALNPRWDPKTEFPDDFPDISELELSPRKNTVYQVIKSVSASPTGKWLRPQVTYIGHRGWD